MRKVALVTGGAKGIGEAVVRLLCNRGYSVVVNYNTSEKKAEELVCDLKDRGADIMTYRCDVSAADDVAKMFTEISTKFGTPLFVVNNAGIAEQSLFTDISDESFEKMIDTNLKGTFNVCREAVKYMVKAKCGSIVNVSSMWGQVGGSCEVHYSASKAGVIGLTKALAKEVGPSNIRVNCVAPGCIDTDMMNSFSDDDIKNLCEEIPLERIGRPEEVANIVEFLLSDLSSYITGQVIGVNGGMVI